MMNKHQAAVVARLLNEEQAEAVSMSVEDEHEALHYWLEDDGSITVADFDGLILGTLN
jgi:hypothetical protein